MCLENPFLSLCVERGGFHEGEAENSRNFLRQPLALLTTSIVGQLIPLVPLRCKGSTEVLILCQCTHTKKVCGGAGYLGVNWKVSVKISTARCCGRSCAGGGHQLPGAHYSQLQLALKPLETTHCAPKHQSTRGSYGGSAHAYLRQSGSCMGEDK